MTKSTNSFSTGGGLPVIQYWLEKSVSPQGVKIWEKLNHKSSCLSCAWGTGGQKGGFVNEAGEYLQRCAKSVEAIASELQEGIKGDFFLSKCHRGFTKIRFPRVRSSWSINLSCYFKKGK